MAIEISRGQRCNDIFMAKTGSAIDRNHNFWQMTSILSASQSITSLLVGGVLSQKFGASVAFSSICTGNLILWLIGLCVISIAEKERFNAIENIKKYLGRAGALLMAVILIFAFLSWYMLDLQTATSSMAPFFKANQGLGFVLLGSGMGIYIALLSRGGIRLIKWVCVVAFPFLLCLVFYGIFITGYIVHDGIWSFSFAGVITVISLKLPGTVNLPTFFRHSRSKADSLIALTLITVFDVIYQMFSIFTQMSVPSDFLTKCIFLPDVLLIAFIIVSLICLNLVNIYFASACLEEITPKLSRPNGYCIIGLLGAISFVFLQNATPMLFFARMSGNFIANFGVVLLVSYLIGVIVKHRPRIFEKTVSCVCLLFGCSLGLLAQLCFPEDPNYAFLIGIYVSVLFYLCVLFIEETIWSIRKLSLRQ